jgi:hypothetical protein
VKLRRDQIESDCLCARLVGTKPVQPFAWVSVLVFLAFLCAAIAPGLWYANAGSPRNSYPKTPRQLCPTGAFLRKRRRGLAQSAVLAIHKTSTFGTTVNSKDNTFANERVGSPQLTSATSGLTTDDIQDRTNHPTTYHP